MALVAVSRKVLPFFSNCFVFMGQEGVLRLTAGDLRFQAKGEMLGFYASGSNVGRFRKVPVAPNLRFSHRAQRALGKGGFLES